MFYSLIAAEKKGDYLMTVITSPLIGIVFFVSSIVEEV
jgi:hypothetical protein